MAFRPQRKGERQLVTTTLFKKKEVDTGKRKL